MHIITKIRHEKPYFIFHDLVTTNVKTFQMSEKRGVFDAWKT